MIFVTVGTHEQPFNRLIKEVDRLKGEGIISEEVIIQTGYCTYEPKYCVFYKMLSYDEMEKYISEARIVITHGGPASFIKPLSIGKTPIIVPRRKMFNEHINDHQFEFCNKLRSKNYNIIVINNICDLEKTIIEYDTVLKNEFCIKNNNDSFCDNLIRLIKEKI